MRTFTPTEAPSFAWRTKNLLFTAQSIKQAEMCYKRKNPAKYGAFDAF